MLTFLKKPFFFSLLALLTTFGCIASRAPSSDANGNNGGVVVVPPPEEDPAPPDDNFPLPKLIQGSQLATDVANKTKLNLYTVRPNAYYLINFGDPLTFTFSGNSDNEGAIARKNYISGVSVSIATIGLVDFSFAFFPLGNNPYSGKMGCVVMYSKSQSRIVTKDNTSPPAVDDDVHCRTMGQTPYPLVVDISQLTKEDRSYITIVQYVGDSVDTADSYFLLPDVESVDRFRRKG